MFVKPRGGWANETETAKLTASDGLANDGFGLMVALSRDTLVAGSGATINGNVGQGAVYVFKGHARDRQHVTENAVDSTRCSCHQPRCGDPHRVHATPPAAERRRPRCWRCDPGMVRCAR